LTFSMSLQVFLQAQLTGTESFLSSSISDSPGDMAELAGRCAWLGLISEILPLALLREQNLARILLGSSGGEQFLLVLPDESIPSANEFLCRAAAAISELSGGELRLVWASTENLGNWPIVRKRLDEELYRQSAAPLIASPKDAPVFAPFEANSIGRESGYFRSFGENIPTATQVSWSSSKPAHLDPGPGEFTWTFAEHASPDPSVVAFPRRFAMDESGTRVASLQELAHHAEGTPRWGILRGDVDHFDQRLRRATTVEEHIQLSVLFKEFFAGELSVLCTMPEFWRKVSILYRGGDDFAVYGAWDGLLALARELQRVFDKFAEQHLQQFAGLEGKTVSMALAIAPDEDSSPSAVFEQAGTQLRAAKAAETGTFHVFGRTLEWKRLADAEELKAGLVRLVSDYGYSPDYIHDLAAVYREAYSTQATRRNKAIRVEKPWRTYLRLTRVIPPARGKDWNNLRSSVITNLVGKSTANLKLRPSSRVGLEWARLAAKI
jgi:CRISPR-associated protein Csm1